MPQLLNEKARIVANEKVGPRLHLMRLESPQIASSVKPGQFVHMKVPAAESHVLRRPFSVYASDVDRGAVEILYQEVGSLTRIMPSIAEGDVEMIGPVGNTWAGPERFKEGSCTRALVVGGGVGAAPLFMLTEQLIGAGCATDVVLGAQTKDALVTLGRYTQLLGSEPAVATDDGSYGHAGFCTALVEERLREGSLADGGAYDYLAVCGPEPLMRIVASIAADAGVPCQVSMEKRMACGVGACLSCVVDTTSGKKRSCVDGPIFDANEVVW
ncbi:MAG: dihydroorotate dehydrogenase electron transfer subunit [Coriobacteriaceae bacterium]|nr:dihydroorotate dehydrogenase electron transfer subunit [Coriobacteriaceae bacterium]